MICDLKEDTVRNWFNNHRSSSKVKTEVKEEVKSGIKESKSPQPSKNNQLTPTNEKDGVVNPSVVDLTDISSEFLNSNCSPLSEETDVKSNEFQIDLHNFETLDLGSLLAK